MFWNAAFDLQILWQDGFRWRPDQVEDVMLAAHLMNENEPNFKLKDTADRHLGGDSSAEEGGLFRSLRERGLTISLSKDKEAEDKGQMWKLPPEEVAPYACKDVELTLRLREFYRPHLERWKLWDLWQEANRYCVVLTDMMVRGVRLDVERLQQLKLESEPRAEWEHRELCRLLDVPDININSYPQMTRALNLASTAEEVLLSLPATHPAHLPGQHLLRARKFKRANSAYYDPYLALRDANDDLHYTLNQARVVSGRLSCSNPNMQQVPRETEIYPIKQVFVARPGTVLVEADYSQAELRYLAYVANDATMRRHFSEGGDLHANTARELGLPRDTAKRLNFGSVYGAGKNKVAQTFSVPVATAESFLASYHGLYPGIRRLYAYIQGVAKRQGYIRLFTGRCRHYVHGGVQVAEPHKAMSNLIQGSVAEMVRISMTRLAAELESEGVRQLLQVHDSDLFEVDYDGDECRLMGTILPEIERIMTDFPWDPPAKVDIKYGTCWGRMEKWTPSKS